jgi:Fe-S cluster assembly protein SufD
MVTFIDINKTKKNRIVFKKPGSFVAFMHNYEGEITFDIQSPKVDLKVYGIYIGRASDAFTLSSTQRHVAPGSSSELFIKGVFYDESKFIYKGLIRIEKTAHGTKAHQRNQNLKLSPNTFVESDPFLEILNNDVSCGHGSTTGALNKEELYYLNSRGIQKKNAEKLLVAGFLNEIVKNVAEFGVIQEFNV